MLAGDLAEFSLPDLFQLLTLTKKTGALRISHHHADGRVYFADGAVYFAVSDDRRLPLGARLVAGGHLQADRLRDLLSKHRGGSPVDVAADLLVSDEVESETLHSYVREQVYDALFTLLRLEDGTFQFEAGSGAEWTGQRHSGPELLDEAGRRIDEWTRLAQHVPARGSVLGLVPNPPGTGALSLTRQQWHLLTLVNGTRTVEELIDLAGTGEFATGRLIGELVEIGLLESYEHQGEGALAELLSGRHALRQLEEVALGAKASQRPRVGSGAERLLTAVGSEPAQSSEPQPWAELFGDVEPEAGEDTESVSAEDEDDDEEEADVVVEVEDIDLEDLEDVEFDEDDEPQDDEAADGSDDPAEDAQEDEGGSEQGAPTAPAASGSAGTGGSFDRAQVARELASLGLDDEPRRVGDSRAMAGAEHGLTRDDDVSRGLLLRMIDGVKGA